MIIDKQTLSDLSFIDDNRSVFSYINCCTAQAGTALLRKWIITPPQSFEALQQRQQATRFWMQHLEVWPSIISNGTLVMVEKYFESAESYAGKEHPISLWINTYTQKLFNKNTYSFIHFSLNHLSDFLKGCRELVQLNKEKLPGLVKKDIEVLSEGLQHPVCADLLRITKDTSYKDLMQYNYRTRREGKQIIFKMIERYVHMDASQAMARATVQQNWVLPELHPPEALCLTARQLYHPLLQQPVPYDISFTANKNFLFLTGANMSGKSTLIRALGVSALLAHIGMGVPAADMEISFLHGIISNMQVEDNIFLGESYFFAEVQRMKLTAQKLSNQSYHLVLMDELFKGTNVHDAYECSKAVIDGLLQQKDNLMALSTHLNELSDGLQGNPNVWFRYCYTRVTEQDYEFTYQLKEGVSKDRIGYMVLKKEGVIDLLHKK